MTKHINGNNIAINHPIPIDLITLFRFINILSD